MHRAHRQQRAFCLSASRRARTRRECTEKRVASDAAGRGGRRWRRWWRTEGSARFIYTVPGERLGRAASASREALTPLLRWNPRGIARSLIAGDIPRLAQLLGASAVHARSRKRERERERENNVAIDRAAFDVRGDPKCVLLEPTRERRKKKDGRIARPRKDLIAEISSEPIVRGLRWLPFFFSFIHARFSLPPRRSVESRIAE